MEIPSKYYDRNIYGIDPRTIVPGFRASADLEPTEAQKGTRRFIANDWDRTGSYILVANTSEMMRSFFRGKPLYWANDESGVEYYVNKIRQGEWTTMEYGVGGAVSYMYEQGTEIDDEPLRPGSHCMDGPFVTTDSKGHPVLDQENPGLWLLAKDGFHLNWHKGFGDLYDKQGKLYVPAEKQPYLHLKP